MEALGTALSDAEFVAERPQRAPTAPAPAPLRILVADDSHGQPPARRARSSPTAAIELDFAGDGRAAVVEAARQRYDLILMDLQMPVLDGLSAIREIREHEREHGRAADADPRADGARDARARARVSRPAPTGTSSSRCASRRC